MEIIYRDDQVPDKAPPGYLESMIVAAEQRMEERWNGGEGKPDYPVKDRRKK